MGYKYPKLCTTLSFQKTEEGYHAEEFLTEDRYFFSDRVAAFVTQLDGKRDPYRIRSGMTREEVDEVLDFLRKEGLLRRSRLLLHTGGSFFWTLLTTPRGREPRLAADVCNTLLTVLFLPVFAAGLIVFLREPPELIGSRYLPGILLGLALGMPLHELSHAAACLAYGGQLFEMGLVCRWLIPGAYVLVDTRPVHDSRRLAQIDAAGIESNLLLTGLFLMLSAGSGSGGLLWFLAALTNFELALINLMLVRGLDGLGILSHLTGIEGLGSMTDLFSPRREGRTADTGRTAVCLITALMQPAFLALIAINILEVIRWLL